MNSQQQENGNSTDFTNIENLQANSDIENPYGFPKPMLPSGYFFKGLPAPQFVGKDDAVTHIKKVHAMPMREDDVLLVAYPKSGTHWMSEIVSHLLKIDYSFSRRGEKDTMFEFMEDFEAMEELPSPRFFNSHYCMPHLPEQIVEKKVKVIHVIRNPKDIIVSQYHHIKQVTNNKFTIDVLLDRIRTPKPNKNEETIFGFLHEMEKFQKENPDHPVLNIHYEDMKQNPLGAIQEVAKFLGQNLTEEECKEIQEFTGFERLKKMEAGREVKNAKLEGFKTTKIFRKGVVGDWKNFFTVAQSELIDEFIARNSEGLNITFRGL